MSEQPKHAHHPKPCPAPEAGLPPLPATLATDDSGGTPPPHPPTPPKIED